MHLLVADRVCVTVKLQNQSFRERTENFSSLCNYCFTRGLHEIPRQFHSLKIFKTCS